MVTGDGEEQSLIGAYFVSCSIHWRLSQRRERPTGLTNRTKVSGRSTTMTVEPSSCSVCNGGGTRLSSKKLIHVCLCAYV